MYVAYVTSIELAVDQISWYYPKVTKHNAKLVPDVKLNCECGVLLVRVEYSW